VKTSHRNLYPQNCAEFEKSDVNATEVQTTVYKNHSFDYAKRLSTKRKFEKKLPIESDLNRTAGQKPIRTKLYKPDESTIPKTVRLGLSQKKIDAMLKPKSFTVPK
jgi:hypothetical protein